MMGKKKQRRMESDGIVGEKTASMHTEAHTNVPREGSKKFVFGHVCKATLSRCRLSCSILSCCSLLIVKLTVFIVWTLAVTHVLMHRNKKKKFSTFKRILTLLLLSKTQTAIFCNQDQFV